MFYYLIIDQVIKIKWLKIYFLDCVGVHNVTALSNLITWQKVDYDFSYHQMEFPCNINVFITSEGRSLLPVRRVILKWRQVTHWTDISVLFLGIAYY